jgi:hypothetical protein
MERRRTGIEPNAAGLSNTNGMCRTIRLVAGMLEPVSLGGETGSEVDRLRWSLCSLPVSGPARRR